MGAIMTTKSISEIYGSKYIGIPWGESCSQAGYTLKSNNFMYLYNFTLTKIRMARQLSEAASSSCIILCFVTILLMHFIYSKMQCTLFKI